MKIHNYATTNGHSPIAKGMQQAQQETALQHQMTQ